MTDPYETLGLPPDADDAAIRQRYLELVRRHTPEQDPARFAAVRAAYEQLRERDARLKYRLFEAGRRSALDAIIEEVACRTPRRRLTLSDLLAAGR